MAKQLGVNPDTIRNWEIGRATPAVWQWPGIIRFLGYVLFTVDGGLSDQLKAYRRLHGLSQERLAALLGVDPSTVWHWERTGTSPSRERFVRLARLLREGGSAAHHAEEP